MTKRTILQLVQDLGSAIGSDEIDTLTETIEVVDIVKILQRTFNEILSRRDWEFLRDRVLQLDDIAGGDTKIFNLVIPINVTKLQCVKYIDDNGNFIEIKYKAPCDFYDLVQAREVADDNVTAILNDDGVALNIITDMPPSFYTSFDEINLSFDAHDSTRGTGNQAADSVIVANIIPTVDFTSPTAVLPIPERMEILVFTEAQATCNYELRQTADPRSERIARRQNIKMRELEPKTRRDQAEVNYGRRTGSGR